MISIQPYFVFATYEYHKCYRMQQGIAHYYNYRYDCEQLHNIMAIPDGCVDLLCEKDGNGLTVRVCGTVLDRTMIASQHNKEYFGVRFHQGIVPVNISMPMKELIENQIDLAVIVDDKDVIKQMEEAADWKACLGIYEHAYMTSMHKRQEPMYGPAKLTEYLTDQMISAKGTIKISQLAEDTAYSERYINKVFSEHMGMGPKRFQEILKFQHVVQLLNRYPHEKLTVIGLKAGYCDQSHFIREFRRNIKMTPGQYQKMIREYHYAERMIIEK